MKSSRSLCAAGLLAAALLGATASADGFTRMQAAACEQVGGYEDASISVQVETYTVEQTTCYVARVRIADPSQLRVAAAYSFERTQTAKPSSIAQRVGAVLAINGDYYSYYGRGYMIRDGVQYGDQPVPGRDVLLIDDQGDFYIERNATAAALEQYGDRAIVNAFNFGPGLVVDGQVLEDYDETFNAANKPRQRCAIAQVERGTLEYLCICCEGPLESDGGGLTMEQFAAFIAGLDVQNAYNLDGGDSTAMILQGEKLNAAKNRNHRAISDIIYFAGAQEDGE